MRRRCGQWAAKTTVCECTAARLPAHAWAFAVAGSANSVQLAAESAPQGWALTHACIKLCTRLIPIGLMCPAPCSADYWNGCNSTTDTGGEVACLTFERYTWQAGKTSGAANLGERQPDASPEDLVAACDANELCAGFTTDGWLKSAGGELLEFEGAGTCDGFYQAQLDPNSQGEAGWRNQLWAAGTNLQGWELLIAPHACPSGTGR